MQKLSQWNSTSVKAVMQKDIQMDAYILSDYDTLTGDLPGKYLNDFDPHQALTPVSKYLL